MGHLLDDVDRGLGHRRPRERRGGGAIIVRVLGMLVAVVRVLMVLMAVVRVLVMLMAMVLVAVGLVPVVLMAVVLVAVGLVPVVLMAMVLVAVVLMAVVLVPVVLVPVVLVAVMLVAVVLVAVVLMALVLVPVMLVPVMLVLMPAAALAVRVPGAVNDGIETVQPDPVDRGERAHRHVQRQSAGLDLIGGNPIAEQCQRLVEQRGEHRIVVKVRVELWRTHVEGVLYGNVREKHEVCRFGPTLAGGAIIEGLPGGPRRPSWQMAGPAVYNVIAGPRQTFQNRPGPVEKTLVRPFAQMSGLRGCFDSAPVDAPDRSGRHPAMQ
ncbi:MAG: hypothetical protein QM766_17585 [Burkholderiaceae bacterium]